MCIEATTGRTGSGYAATGVRVGRRQYSLQAHRVAFEQAWGVRLKPGQVVRHTCANRGCVNPLHLMIGTQGDNNRDTVAHGRHEGARKTHCVRGHVLAGDNLIPWHLERGHRECRACKNERFRRYRAEGRIR